MRPLCSLFSRGIQFQQIRRANTSAASHKILGPAVRLIILNYGINENDVKPSGPKGNLLKSDVLHFVEMGKLKPVPSRLTDVRGTAAVLGISPAPKVAAPKLIPKPGEAFVDIPLTNMRSTIAKRLLASKRSIPHAYASITVNADLMSSLRSKLKDEGVSVSVNDFIIKAAACALRAVPEINVQYTDGKILWQNSVDISVAVATPAGLITPIVFNADRLGVAQIGEKVRELAKKAKENKLQPPDFQGGTFTISNLGMFGSISSFTAIINPPQAAILAIGGTQKEIGEYGTPKSTFTVTLCYDNRAITELDAQRFLEHFKLTIGHPDFMIVGTSVLSDLSDLC